MALTPFNFTYRKLEFLDQPDPRGDTLMTYEDDEPRCQPECGNLVPDYGDKCPECLAYEAELRADCARSYYDRPANREDIEASIDAYSDPTDRAKRTRMLELGEQNAN